MWRWDQGRLHYFEFNNILKIARVLETFSGKQINTHENNFRSKLISETDLPFSPDNYSILRNYKRVFECSFLATYNKGILLTSDFCHELANTNGYFQNADDFFLNYINRFRFPFPAFQGYDITVQPTYPYCAIIKLLIAFYITNRESKLSVRNVLEYIIANNSTGIEDMDYYINLSPHSISFNKNQYRQIREMLIFISQLSLLKYRHDYLWLDIENDTPLDDLLTTYLNPFITSPSLNRTQDFITITHISRKIPLSNLPIFKIDPSFRQFIEGKRHRVIHFRIERSPLLRKEYISLNNNPICDMCQINVKNKYPWTDYMLDIHHLLPLSSNLKINNQGTSFSDIVALCPSCHKSIHIYYAKWLNRQGQDDFLSEDEAKAIYLAAKSEMS